ncbi:hypothetical protein Efla_001018 [Eimeria flavescens]
MRRWFCNALLSRLGRNAEGVELQAYASHVARRKAVRKADISNCIPPLNAPRDGQSAAAVGLRSGRRYLGTFFAAGPTKESEAKSAHSGERAEGSLSPSLFASVADESSHWLPSLGAALKKQSRLSSLVAAAAKGDSTSADPTRLQQKAKAATAQLGWKIPQAAVLVFHDDCSSSSADLLRWLSNAFEDGGQQLELISVLSDSAPLLTKAYNVMSIPHCVLLVRGCVACELPAGSSAARRAAFVATAAAAASFKAAGLLLEEVSSLPFTHFSPKQHLSGIRGQPGNAAASQRCRAQASYNPDALQTADGSFAGPLQGDPMTGRSKKSIQPLAGFPAGNNREEGKRRSGCYLLDSDKRASRLAALAVVALFDAPQVATKNLHALHEALQQRLAKPSGKPANAATPKECPLLPAGLRSTLESILEAEEPQWSVDDCPAIRCLPLFNQLTLNANLFSKAHGSRPSGAAMQTVPSVGGDSLQVSHWQMTEWLARTRRCLAARLFLDSSETAALRLAAFSHKEWLEAAAAFNFMQLRLRRGKAFAVTESAGRSGGSGVQPAQNSSQREGLSSVHPFDVWSEPRAPSPGRALLSSMYTALGPEDSRVHRNFAELATAVNTADFHPTKFSHTRARRGGKPRMMRGRSGRWFWLGPYWKPPWAPKKRRFAESWHLSNFTA